MNKIVKIVKTVVVGCHKINIVSEVKSEGFSLIHLIFNNFLTAITTTVVETHHFFIHFMEMKLENIHLHLRFCEWKMKVSL